MKFPLQTVNYSEDRLMYEWIRKMYENDISHLNFYYNAYAQLAYFSIRIVSEAK